MDGWIWGEHRDSQGTLLTDPLGGRDAAGLGHFHFPPTKWTKKGYPAAMLHAVAL